MITGIHIVMTYTCNLECDHCFVFAGPEAPGLMTIGQIRSLLDEAGKMAGVEWIYFEGGEPFLYYPVLLEGIRLARERGLKVGLVTNSYAAVSGEDADLWFRPLAKLGLDYLNISDDFFHYEAQQSPAKTGLAAAARLGIPVDPICIKKPYVEAAPGEGGDKGAPIIGGGAMFRGRAVEKLTQGLPLRPWPELVTCPYEELRAPDRVHVDPYGHVHLCQGVSLGNAFARPLGDLFRDYDPQAHPVAGPLLAGGPAELARRYQVDIGDAFVDECHFCFLVRRALLDRFPEVLAPRQVYGL